MKIALITLFLFLGISLAGSLAELSMTGKDQQSPSLNHDFKVAYLIPHRPPINDNGPGGNK